MRCLALHASLLLLALPAAAIVIDLEDDSRARQRPTDDPGWDYVGRRGSTTAIYLGDGWVLTAGHVLPGSTRFDGRAHAFVPHSTARLRNADGSEADLRLYRIESPPPLPALPLRAIAVKPEMRIRLVSWGVAGAEPIEQAGVPGYRWTDVAGKRWGTNRVRRTRIDLPSGALRTQSFDMSFDRPGTRFEAQGALGDSGGAVFAKSRGRWELAGVLVTIGARVGQPPRTSLIGNLTNAADVSHYREQILRIMAEGPPPAPEPGSPSGP